MRGFVFSGLLCVFGGLASAENWDMPVAYGESTYHTATAREFAQCVSTATGGELTLTVHSAGSLLSGSKIKSAISTGNVQIGERLLSAHQDQHPIFGIDSVPFLASSFEESERLWLATRPVMNEVLREQNLHMLYSVPWPPQGLFSDRKVDEIADLEGARFRSYNQATARLAELIGMQAVRVAAADLNAALETGTAQSLISSAATGYGRGVWQHLSHFYAVDAWLPRNHVMVNLDAWKGLSPEHRNILSACGRMAEYAGLYRAREYNQLTMSALRDEGMLVDIPGGVLRAQLLELGRNMVAEWLVTAGPEASDAIDYYLATDVK